MSISTLPDLCLLFIFDRIPLYDLCVNINQVCHRWYSLHSSACHRRQTLIVLEEEEDLHYCTDISMGQEYHINGFDHITNDDGSPFLVLPQKSQLKDHSLVISQLEKDICHKLLPLFCKVSSLSLICSFRNYRQLGYIGRILKHLNGNLKYLKLKIILWGNEFEDNEDENINSIDKYQKGFDQLFDSMTKLTALKNLDLNFDFEKNTKCPIVLKDLPIVQRLEKFRFQYSGFSESQYITTPDTTMFNLLNRYEKENKLANLNISYYKQTSVEQLFLLDSKLANKLIELCLPLNCDLNRFCGHFSSLTALSLASLGSMSLGQLTSALVQLPQLYYLGLYIDFNDFNPSKVPHLQPLLSIKALNLRVTKIASHGFVNSLHLSTIFPKVQVIWFWASADVCLHCEIGWIAYDPDDDQEQYENCLRQMRAQFKDCLTLRKLYFTFMSYTTFAAAFNADRHRYPGSQKVFSHDQL